MEILILKQAHTPNHYRGVDGKWPYYVDNLPPDHPVNQTFLKFVHSQNTFGVLSDLASAQEVVETYAHLTPPQNFEIRELVFDNAQSEVGQELLGFDLADQGHNSLLERGLKLCGP